jgi:hypothetical protein
MFRIIEDPVHLYRGFLNANKLGEIDYRYYRYLRPVKISHNPESR